MFIRHSGRTPVCVVFFHDQSQRRMSELLAKLGVEVSSWHMLRDVVNASLFLCLQLS